MTSRALFRTSAAGTHPSTSCGVTRESSRAISASRKYLSWSERELPERERTKHVHRLHPYLGKYIPQLVEELFRRHVPARGRVLDPFAGSGTTLVAQLTFFGQTLDGNRVETGGGVALVVK